MDPFNQLVRLTYSLRGAQNPVFITGAGISVASGIEPFRGTAGAVWSTTVMEMGTQAKFQQDPVSQWKWYLERFLAAKDLKPNAAHISLAEMAQVKPSLRVITQNVDGLHHAAKTPQLIEVHGATRKIRCSSEDCKYGAPSGTLPFDPAMFQAFLEDNHITSLPTCPACGSLLRPHVLWFDEYYSDHIDYRYNEVCEWLDSADLFVFVGTSFSVGFTDLAVTMAGSYGVPMWTIDPHATGPHRDMHWLQGKSEKILPLLVQNLKKGGETGLPTPLEIEF